MTKQEYERLRKEKDRAAKKTQKKQSVQDKFVATRQEISSALIEREDEVDVVLTALLCSENPLLVGQPGTAKSMLLDTLMSWMSNGVKKFSTLMTKFSTPEDIFGQFSVQALKNDEYRRVTKGKLAEADVGFVDEVFKANTAILNSLLKIMNERRFDPGNGVEVQVPLIILVAASNEFPDGQELGAMFDRFLLRKKVQYIRSAHGKARLIDEAIFNGGIKPQLSTTITRQEIDEAQSQAAELEWDVEARTTLDEILDELAKEGIMPGDRRVLKSIRAVRAFAYLCGEQIVYREHLEMLSHILWNDPAEQPEKCARIVSKLASPTGAKINDLLLQMQDVVSKCQPAEAITKLKEIKSELDTVDPNHPKWKQASRFVTTELKRQNYRNLNLEVDDE